MHAAVAAPLEAWGSFYVIVGSSAGALTGLQFVVMTLIAQTEFGRGRGDSVAAFGSPNVVHFCGVLLVASILSVPWGSLRPAGLAVAGCGIAGIVYAVVVMRRAQRQQDYVPVFEDWVWHTMLPLIAYTVLLVAGLMLGGNPAGALLAIGAAALLLVLIGIHNAWDTVTYITMRSARERQEPRVGAATADPRKSSGPEPRARTEAADPRS